MGYPGGVEQALLWQRCRGVAESIPLPEPFGITELTRALALRRGRPIELVPLSGPDHSPCGVLISTDRADYIGYPADTTALHQQHIVLHEIGHLLCGHTGNAGSPGSTGGAGCSEGAGLSGTVAQVLTPGLSEELVRRVLGRSGYTERQEQEAELVASLALQRAVHRPRSTAVGQLADQVGRLRHLFGRPLRLGAARRG
ncbi:ParH-like protein [Kitasatospora sp. NPDC088391]|uniref:ParH-like protein n=1 Tax=Kitasatospora sp. NPDC088391 TaxID=3364074 RepID=UPI00381E1E2A